VTSSSRESPWWGRFAAAVGGSLAPRPAHPSLAMADWLSVLRPKASPKVSPSCRREPSSHNWKSLSCTTRTKRVKPPQLPSASKAWREFTAAKEHNASRPRARVWMLIPFGFELSMLCLHIETLRRVVDGFVIVESRADIARGARKPAHLSASLASRQFPADLARAIVRLAVLDDNLDERAHPGCGRKPDGYSYTFHSCLEAWQRFRLLWELLTNVRAARPEDIVLLADTDEIARPEAIDFLRECYPFGRGNDSPEPAMIVLEARVYTYGLHCRRTPSLRREVPWQFGPHAFTLGFLNRTFLPSSLVAAMHASNGSLRSPTDQKAAASFSASRGQYSGFSRPTMLDAAWHLTYFGTAAQLVTKFTTWGHARTFVAEHAERGGGFVANGHENASLDPARIDRCARLCLEPSAKSCQALGLPCDWPAFRSNAVPPCSNRTDGQSVALPGTAWCPTRADHSELRAGADYPAPLGSRTKYRDFWSHTQDL